MLMNMVTRRSFETVRKELPKPEFDDHLERLLDQIVDIISELGSHNRQHIGGLQKITGLSDNERDGSMIVPGPVVNETMWQIPESDLFWASRETF